tara:strand:- start:404 stop:595 length:192 start_codon:yes stop_codon:yes gene_type:complete
MIGMDMAKRVVVAAGRIRDIAPLTLSSLVRIFVPINILFTSSRTKGGMDIASSLLISKSLILS